MYICVKMSSNEKIFLRFKLPQLSQTLKSIMKLKYNEIIKVDTIFICENPKMHFKCITMPAHKSRFRDILFFERIYKDK